MMPIKRAKKNCTDYYVAVVDGDPYDSYAATTKAAARKIAAPDRGSKVAYWKVCARDVGEARLPSTYKRGKKLK